VSIGTITGNVRRGYVQVPLPLAFSTLATLPVLWLAWVSVRFSKRRAARARGFDVQPVGNQF
jgi:hypothetical protein